MKKNKNQCDMCLKQTELRFGFEMCCHLNMNGEFSKPESWDFCTIHCVKAFIDKMKPSGFTSTISNLRQPSIVSNLTQDSAEVYLTNMED